jgi:hypothetical protein
MKMDAPNPKTRINHFASMTKANDNPEKNINEKRL